MTDAMVREDGTYPVEELRRDMILAAVIQTRVHGVNGDNPGPDIRRNLDSARRADLPGNRPPSSGRGTCPSVRGHKC